MLQVLTFLLLQLATSRCGTALGFNLSLHLSGALKDHLVYWRNLPPPRCSFSLSFVFIFQTAQKKTELMFASAVLLTFKSTFPRVESIALWKRRILTVLVGGKLKQYQDCPWGDKWQHKFIFKHHRIWINKFLMKTFLKKIISHHFYGEQNMLYDMSVPSWLL